MTPDALTAFGCPGSLVRSYDHWLVLAAPRQVTIGTLILAYRGAATTLGAVSDDAWREFPSVIRQTEEVLAACFKHDRLNMLFLMMAVPEVHAAIIPRYAETRTFGGVACADPGWPRKPDLDAACALTPETHVTLVERLRDAYAHAAIAASSS